MFSVWVTKGQKCDTIVVNLKPVEQSGGEGGWEDQS